MESICESGMRLNCDLPVSGTLLHERMTNARRIGTTIPAYRLSCCMKSSFRMLCDHRMAVSAALRLDGDGHHAFGAVLRCRSRDRGRGFLSPPEVIHPADH